MITTIVAALAAAQAAPAATPATVDAQHAQHQQASQHAHDHQQMAKMMEHCKEMMKNKHSGHEKTGTQDHREYGGH
jgi:hypothetical protein